jgi:hypothetical protein
VIFGVAFGNLNNLLGCCFLENTAQPIRLEQKAELPWLPILEGLLPELACIDRDTVGASYMRPRAAAILRYEPHVTG